MSEQVFERQHGDTFPRRCKHFDGIDYTDPEKRCKAGMLMSEATVDQPFKYRYDGRGAVYTAGRSSPCFKGDDPFGVCNCPHQEFPTAEEYAEYKRETGEIINRTFKARVAIIEHAGGKRGVVGDLPCPVCGTGTLRYTIAGRNGHVWAACSTENCVKWME